MGRLDVISRWLISTRAAVLIMTFISATIAGLLALRAGVSSTSVYWLLVVVGLVFAHALNNLLNDLTDFERGVDKDNYFRTQYGPQPLQQGLMTRKELLTYAAVTGLIALAAGLYLVHAARAGWPGCSWPPAPFSSSSTPGRSNTSAWARSPSSSSGDR